MGRHLAVYAAFFVLAAALTWPAVAELDRSVPGEKFMVTYYIYRWVLDAPFSEWLTPTFSGFNHPEGGSVVIVGLPQFFVAWLAAPLVGADRALNLSLVGHLALGGYGGWRLYRAVTGGEGVGAWVTGVVWGFSNHAVAAFANGQSENLGFGWLAFAFEAAWAAGRGGGVRAAVATVLGVAVCFLSSPYLVMAFLLVAAPLALRGLLGAHRRVVAGTAAGVLAVTGLFFLHFQRTLPGQADRLFCPFALEETPEPGAVTDLRALGRVLQRPDLFTQTLVVDPAWAVVPHRTWGTKAHEIPANYVGLLTLALGAWGLARAPGRRWWLLAAGPALVLGLGPNLQVNGWVLAWDGAPLRLPLYALRHTPVVEAVIGTVNAPHRLLVAVYAPLAVLAGLGAARLGRAGWAALGLLVVEGFTLSPSAPPQPLFPIPAVDVYAELAARDDGRALLDTPPVGYSAGPPLRPPVTFGRMLMGAAWQHGRPIPYAPCAPALLNERVADSAFGRIVADVLVGRGDGRGLAEAARALSAQGYGWYVVHTGTGLVDAAADARLLAAARAELEEVARGDDGSVLFRLPGG